MLTINLGEFGIYEIDENNLPLNDALTDVLNSAESGSALSELIPLSMVYYNKSYKEEFIKILKFVIKHTNFAEDLQQNAQSLLNSYYLNERVRNKSDKEISLKEDTFADQILKGVFFLVENDLESANKSFSECKFDLGLEMVYLLRGEKHEFRNKTLKLINEYLKGSDVTELEDYKFMNENVKFKTDPLFRAQSDIYNKTFVKDCLEGKRKSRWMNNVDALLEMANQFISEDFFYKILDFIPECNGKYFLQGKFFHLQGNFNDAIINYKKSNLPEAQYNLIRIKQDSSFELLCKNTETLNFYSFLANKLNLSDNFENEVNDFYKTIKNPSFFTLRKLINNRYVNQANVLNNISFYLWLELERYKVYTADFIPFNFPREKKEIKNITKESVLSIKEQNCDYLNLNNKLKNQKDLVYQIIKFSKDLQTDHLNVIENNIDFLQNDSLYSSFIKNTEEKDFTDELLQINYLRSGKNELIDKSNELIYYLANYKNNLTESLTYFKKRNSVYAKNGAGLCFIEKGQLNEAECIFQKLSLELPYANINLGNTLFLKKEYESALNSYKKVPLCSYTFKMILKLAQHLKNKEILEEIKSIIKKGNFEKEIVILDKTVSKIEIMTGKIQRSEIKDEEMILFYDDYFKNKK